MMKIFDKPRIISLPKIGNSTTGYISLAEYEHLPFVVKRIYWTYFTPESIVRGHHAHYELEQILVAVSGKITVYTEMPDSTKESFTLDSPHIGILLPKFCWHTMQYSHDSVQMCIASMEYDQEDYVKDYEVFKKLT